MAKIIEQMVEVSYHPASRLVLTRQHSIDSFSRLFDGLVESQFCSRKLLMYSIDDSLEEWHK
jgi:hypothetical protein